jgi:hypothetical protein
MLTKRHLMRASTLAALSGGVTISRRALAQTDRPGFLKSRDIAEGGFVYGLPIVTNYAVMYNFAIDRKSSQFRAPFNVIASDARLLTYKDTSVPVPNADTPYSILFMDLRAEPLVISVPTVNAERYYSVQFCDGNTYNYGYIGTRATGNVAGDFLVAGPDWKGEAPTSVRQVFHSSTQFSLAMFRTQLFNSSDIANVARVQAGFKAVPLSTYLGKPAPPPAPTVDFPPIDGELAKTNFFDYVDFAMQFAPPQPNETDIRAQLARIGIGPGRTFNFDNLSLAEKLEIGLGLRTGNEKVEAAVANAGIGMNGWRVTDINGSSAGYHGDWLARAVVRKSGIYANDTVEACYPFTRNDSDGQPLDGSQHIYTLTFPPGQMPPVNAFWSLTMYDGKTQLLVENPINRYLINSPMLPSLKINADGSLTIYIQSRSPGMEKESNWLPAPNGPIYLVMRLYWPKTGALSILPVGQGTWRPPGVVRKSYKFCKRTARVRTA